MSLISSWFQKIASARSRFLLKRYATLGDNVDIRGRIWIHGPGKVHIGNRVVLDGSTWPIELNPEKGAEIAIGDDVHIDGGASIWALKSITVGARCHLGTFCKLMDNHYHSLSNRDLTTRPASAAVLVEDDVRIGPYSILLSGAHVGRSTVIHERTVVTRRIAPGVEVRGNPAVVRKAGAP